MRWREKVGYCTGCASDVVHVRVFDSVFPWVLDRLTIGAMGTLGFGPWRCIDCGHKSMRLAPPRVPLDQSLQHEDRPSRAIGNYILSELSLVNLKQRGARFSEKFKHAIVDRLLTGRVTISQICRELDVSEIEVQFWIKEVFDRYALQRGSEGQEAGDQASRDTIRDDVVIDSSVVRRKTSQSNS